MGKRSRRKRPGRGAATLAAGHALPRDSLTSTANAGAAPTLADQHRVTVAERQRRNWERGEPRAEANRMMQEFLSLRNEDPWNSQRLSAFDSYVTFMMVAGSRKFDYDSKQVHIKFLKKIRRSKTEPAFYRALAHETTGHINLFIAGSFDAHGEALEHFEKAISIYKSADASEKGLIVSLHGDAISIGEYYENHVSSITGLAFCYRGKFSIRAWSPTGGCDLNVALPAGVQCDCCEKYRKEDLGEEDLRRCGRCKMAFYCSAACQQKAWKEQGHRLVCRKKGEFKAGDVAVLTKSVGGICSGQHVELFAPVPDDESQSSWVVKEKHGDEVDVVAEKSLKQVRSVLWRAWTEEDLAEIREMVLERDRNKADHEAEDEDVPLPELLSSNDCKEDADSDDENEE